MSESGCDSQQPKMQGLLSLLFMVTEYADCRLNKPLPHMSGAAVPFHGPQSGTPLYITQNISALPTRKQGPDAMLC